MAAYVLLAVAGFFITPWQVGEYINIVAASIFISMAIAFGGMGFRAFWDGYERWHVMALGLFFIGLGIAQTRGVYSQALRVFGWEHLRFTMYPPFVFLTLALGGGLMMLSIIMKGNNKVPPKMLWFGITVGGCSFVSLMLLSIIF
ncbi:MAG: hypothetical protein AB7F96_22275 [Beijerinckiaceae bacterium]